MAAFIKFSGIDGECKDKSHKTWTDISSVSVSLEKPGEGLTGQSRRRGDVKLNDITCTKELDSSSSALCENICMGTVFATVEVDLTASYAAAGTSAAEAGRQTYLWYKMINVAVSSYSISGDGEEPPQEEFSLNYEKLYCKYIQRAQDGSVIKPLEWGWDVEESTAWTG